MRHLRRGPGAPSLAIIAVATAAVMGAFVAAAGANGLSIEAAVSDPHELTRLRLLGVVSNLGVLVWGSAVSACLLAASLVPAGTSDRRRAFLITSAALSSMLLIDDLFLVHEFSDEVVGTVVDFDRTRAQKDVLEFGVFAVYAALFGAYLYAFRSTLLAVDGLRYLVAAFLMFAVSIVIDLGLVEPVGIRLPDHRSSFNVEALAEEGPKLVGIVYYAAFSFSVSRQFVRDGLRATDDRQPVAR